VSLNSVQFNLARAVGPALAGLAYGAIGPQGCFALNAAGFLVMTLLLARVRIPHRPPGTASPVLHALRESFRYVRHHAVIAPALLLAGAMSLFGFPYIVLLPALARDTLHLDATGLGFLMASVGAGAVVGGLGLSATGALPRRNLVPVVAAIVFGILLTLFAVVRSPRATALLLFCVGVVQTASVASLNTTIQLHVHDGMRGRVMSMMTVILFGFTTTGALLVGTVGDLPAVGVPGAIAAGGVVIALAGVAVLRRAPALTAARA
jgi:predicted MFS family arabinose efflux permease